MKRTIINLIFLVVLISPVVSFAGGSCTTETKEVDSYLPYRILWEWTSSGASEVGSVGSVGPVSGTIVGVEFIPTGSGTSPVALYDVKLLDANGRDVLYGMGMNLPQSPAALDNYRTLSVTLFESTLTPSIANCGVARQGSVALFIDQQ